MKILFLDIDGVLNSKRSELALGHERTIDNLDPICIKLVQMVVEETGCLICLSSDWRYRWDYKELGIKLGLPILFETGHYEKNDRDNKQRSKEIQEVIDGLEPEKFAILDDNEYDHEFDGMNFVDTMEEIGIGYMDYKLLIEYLK